MRQFIYNNGDSEAHINANVVARIPSRFEVWDWFSVEIRPNMPVPILVENEHLQIWQLLAALLAFLELKRSHLHIVYVLNKQRKPRNILMRVCLLIFGCCHWFFFDNLRANGACYERGVLQNTGSCLQAHYSSLGPARGLPTPLLDWEIANYNNRIISIVPLVVLGHPV